MTEHPAVGRTRRWVERVVIGLGLCPFAARPFVAGRIVYAVCDAQELEGIYRCFLEQLACFLWAAPEQQETALVLVPAGLEDFSDYLEVLAIFEGALDAGDLRGIVQLASFHPDYRFEGAVADDPANYTNRSPVPMFHLIREAALSDALEGYPAPERIPRRNVRHMRELGLAKVRALLDETGGPEDVYPSRSQ